VSIYVGELPSGSSERAERVAGIIDASGVRSTAVPDVLSREWTKFVAWAGLMLMSITTRAVTWRYLSDPDCALVLVRLVREVAGIAKAAGVPLTTEDTLLPLQGILGDSEAAAVQAVLQAGRHFHANSPNHRLSSLQDLEAGRPLEIQETLGYAVGRAQELHQPVPLLDALYHLAVAIDRTRDHAALPRMGIRPSGPIMTNGKPGTSAMYARYSSPRYIVRRRSLSHEPMRM
jgi:2-dehydropantoate 2-reductase